MATKKQISKSARPSLKESDFMKALTDFGGPQARKVAQNPKLFKATFDLVKAWKSSDPVAATSALASGANAGAKLGSASQGLKTATQSTSFVLSEFKATMDLAKLTKLTSPGAIGVFVGATVVHKTGLAVSLAGATDEQAQCLGAVMELAGSATLTALTAPTGVLLVLSAASLTASAYNAYLSCAPQP